MQAKRTLGLALLGGIVLATAGCYYRVENYGYSREIGIGKIGCEVARPVGRPLPMHGVGPAAPGEHIVATPSADIPRITAAPPQAPPTSPQAAKTPAAPSAAGASASVAEVLAPFTSLLPKLTAPTDSGPRPPALPASPEKGWVGLPPF